MSQADPFREIVKQNIQLYREAEEYREMSFKKNFAAMQEWKKYNEVYVRAAKCFAICEKCDLMKIGIFDDRPLEKHVDILKQPN
jgi:hypothetical protein